MKILSIGNSFSEDAQRYLHSVAASDGLDVYTVNLCIGGCTLEAHYNNMNSGEANYTFQENGIITERKISIDEALMLENWDVVTLQQASPYSFKEDSYYPYITELASYIRERVPGAKLVIHQTWAYEDGSDAMLDRYGDADASKMLADVKITYHRAAKEVNADGIIPSGELLGELAIDMGIKVHKDTLHASLGLGRYAIALLWYRSLTGRSVLKNSFAAFDESVSEEQINVVKTVVESYPKII